MYILTSPAAAEPVLLAEAKQAARIDSDAFDTLIPGMIIAAREIAMQETGRRFITETWQLTLEEWPSEILLERSPFKSLELVEYWNGSAWVTLASSQYVLVPGVFFATIKPALNVTWPTLVDAVGPRVRITFKAGYGESGTSVPESVKLWIKANVAYWVRSPEAASDRVHTPSPFLASMLDPVKVWA
jgi:uncharacterized phiE125 gp8 family phage protein